MKYKVKASLDLDDGTYTGTITKVDDNPPTEENKYHYCNIWIAVDEKEVNAKYSCPANVTEKSRLGKLLTNFGAILKPGDEIDPQPTLLNQRCKFMVVKSKGKDGNEYSEIVEDSVKPLNEKQPVQIIQA